jgi:predicted lipoprotein with Yx(FWY)xxD motif
MKRSTLSTLVILVVIVTITYYGCKKSDSGGDDDSSSKYAVSLATDSAGMKYLVDNKGYTLYFFSNDFKGRNSCAGACAGYWPYFYARIVADSLGPDLNMADFDTIMVGSMAQTRYKGWPLYYYAPAGNSVFEPEGKITGEKVANWFVARPNYSIMLANGQLVGSNGKNYVYTGTYAEGTGRSVYFTDARGLTLYTYTPDSFNINKYTKADFSNNSTWPIYDTTLIVVPPVLDKTQFGSISLYGKHQLTYKGWPLYYYGGDSKVQGNNKGFTVPTSGPVGGKWPIVAKDITAAPHK